MTASNTEDRLGQLFAEQQFEDYVSLYFDARESIPEKYQDLYHAEVTQALMALRRYGEALDAATKFHQSGERTPKFARDLGRGLDLMGACQWMLGRKDEAIATWAQLCEGVMNGNYEYAKDVAGGIGYGLLLWFGAVMTDDERSKAKAESYLENRWRRVQTLTPNAFEIWPVPAARGVLGEIQVAEMIGAATRNPSFLIDEPREMKRSDATARRNLSAALLMAGADARHRGQDDEAHLFFGRAAALKNPVSDVFWCLARYEVEKRARAKFLTDPGDRL
jgi:tetratricopeptide (TPR) repeat protein